MSKPTRFGASIPILRGRLGYTTPPEPDADPEDPTNYASQDEAAAVQVGIDVGSPGFIQEATGHTDNAHITVSATFASPPEVGNTLIAVLVNRGTGTVPTLSGWTKAVDAVSTSFDGGRITLWYKTAGASESSTVTVTHTDEKDLYIAEWEGLGAIDGTPVEVNSHSASTSLSVGTLTPSSGRGVLFGGFVQAARNPTLTIGSGFTDEMNVDTNASGPAGIFGSLEVDPFSGSYSFTATSSLSKSYGGFILAFAAASDDTVWYPGPGVNDGDTATSDFSDAAGPCLRVALETERLIYRIELDVGQASAGATVYELYGSDDAAFTSPVLLATLTFTATGSYTLDTVTASWVPTTTYQYFQLEHVSGGGSDREFFEVRLFSATSVVGVSDHGALTGLAEDDHPQYTTEAEVDAIIAELDATDIPAIADHSLAGDTIQEQLDELAGLLISGSGGTLSAGGSPVAITNDSSYNAFPGVARLDDSRVLLVYRKGTDHASTNDGRIVGKIGTLASDRQSVSSWGTEFEIYNHASLDVRCEDAVAVIDGVIYVSGRLYDGSDNQSPFLLICDDPAAEFTSASTWTKHDINLTTGSDQNYTQGHLVKLANGTYLQPVGWDSGGTHAVGVGIVSDPTNWAAPTFHTVGSGANDYAEIEVIQWPDGTLRAHFNRAAGAASHYYAESTDHGATWTSPAVLFTGIGYPAFRRLPSGLHLSVYRSNDGSTDSAWRQGNSSDASYGSETILDSTGSFMQYATILALTRTKILAIYGIQNSSTDADIRSQIFTDSSTFAATFDEPVADAHIADTTDAHDASAISAADAGDYYTSTDVEGQLQEAGSDIAALQAASGGASGGDHEHVIDVFNGDASTTAFELSNEPLDPEQVFAFVGGSWTAVTMSGVMNTTATFGSAPGSGTGNVVIQYPAVAA